MPNTAYYYINGKFVDSSKAKLSINDLGFLRGYGVFDFLVTYNKRPFLMPQHVDRLLRSAKLIGLKTPWTAKQLEILILNAIKKNKQLSDMSIKIIITGGVSTDGITPSKNPTLAILVNERRKLPKKLYSHGAKVITVDIQREIPKAKTLNYTNAVYCMIKARENDASEAIYIDALTSNVFEGTTSNIFIIKNSKVFTPKSNILSGVTREVVIELIRKRYKIYFGDIKIKQLKNADEVFITASNKEILPITKIDNFQVGNNYPGEITKVIMSDYQEFIKLNL